MERDCRTESKKKHVHTDHTIHRRHIDGELQLATPGKRHVDGNGSTQAPVMGN
jgi:hypothetical protein